MVFKLKSHLILFTRETEQDSTGYKEKFFILQNNELSFIKLA